MTGTSRKNKVEMGLLRYDRILGKQRPGEPYNISFFLDGQERSHEQSLQSIADGCSINALLRVSGNDGSTATQEQAAVGAFEAHGDVGNVLHAGSVEYDRAKKSYTLAGSGENMWLGADAFQFVWNTMSGDTTLSADISFLGGGGNAHRKAVVMIRQNLDADSVYADVALHGNGLTALQFRDEKGGITQEVQSQISAPGRVRIEKHGAYFTMWLVGPDGKFEMAGGSPKIALKEPFYVGIGVCSHDKDVVERAVFSNVELTAEPINATGKLAAMTLYSVLETVGIDSGDRTAVYISAGRFEAPNWTRDGKAFLLQSPGKDFAAAGKWRNPADDRHGIC